MTGHLGGGRRRTYAVEALVCVLAVLALVGGGFATRDRLGTGPDLGDAAAYVPADGFRTVSRSGQDVVVSENARLPLAVALATAPGGLAGALLSEERALLRTDATAWRQTQVTYGDATSVQGIGTYALTTRGIEQVSARLDGIPSLVFDPPLLSLPRDLTPGRSVTSSGDATPGGGLRYRSKDTVKRSSRAGCMVSSGTLELLDDTGKVLVSSDSDSTWCRGKGIVNESAPVPAPPASLFPAAPTLDLDPAALSATDVAARGDDETFGPLPYDVGTVETPPAVLADGTVVVAESNTGDVLALTRDGTALVTGWRAHPGGTPGSVTAVGNVVVVSTSRRQLCGYDDTGAWLWCRHVGDLADTPGVRFGSDGYAVVTLDGRLRLLDARTGRQRWTTDAEVQTRFSPVVAGGRVVTVAADGTVTGWRTSTGTVAWRRTTAGTPSALAARGDRVAVVGDLVDVLDGRTGSERWSTSAPGSVTGALVTDDTVVVGTEDGVRAFDATGERWHATALAPLAGDGSTVLGLADDRLVALSTDGREVGHWPLPRSARGQDAWLLATPDGPLLLAASYTGVALS
ncbi:MAG: hypothetical protein JWO46_2493 [Nocardioidaceae bacterium]|nr:hypothetical protein [Nocardioidaceae bacterium]